MANYLKKFESFFGSDIGKLLQDIDVIDIAQLNAIVALLVKLNLPFDLSFTQATNEIVASAELNITLTPTTTIKLLLPFARGPTST